MQVPLAPGALVYVPGPHRTPTADVESLWHTLPGGARQDPLQLAVDSPATDPKVPSGHGTHCTVLLLLLAYCPAGQGVPVGLVAPATHTLPGAASHGPLHVLELAPGSDPYRPLGHNVQVEAPPRLNLPVPAGSTPAKNSNQCQPESLAPQPPQRSTGVVIKSTATKEHIPAGSTIGITWVQVMVVPHGWSEQWVGKAHVPGGHSPLHVGPASSPRPSKRPKDPAAHGSHTGADPVLWLPNQPCAQAVFPALPHVGGGQTREHGMHMEEGACQCKGPTTPTTNGLS